MKKMILCAAALTLVPAAAWTRAEGAGRIVTLPVKAAGREDHVPLMEDPTVTEILVAEGNEAFISIGGYE